MDWLLLSKNQGRASGGREMVELGHPPGNETARSIPGKLAGNLKSWDTTMSDVFDTPKMYFVALISHYLYILHMLKHKPRLLQAVRRKIQLVCKSPFLAAYREYSWRFQFQNQILPICSACGGHTLANI